MANLIDCYIIDLLTDDKIEFQLIPDEVSDTVSTAWDTTDIRGRTAPFFGYSSNPARTVSFSIILHADYCKNILSTVNKIKSLCYPSIRGCVITPPICYVRFGNMIKMKAIVENVSVSWQKPIIENSKYFSQAELSLEFTQYYASETLPNHSTMRTNGGNNLSL